MIHAGTDLKFQVTAKLPGFTMKHDDFSIIVKNRWGQVKYIIEKDDMLKDDSDNFYFILTDVHGGSYYAVFTAHRSDTDYEDDIQRVVDKQLLCVVGGGCDCGNDSGCGCDDGTDGMAVAYKRVWTVCINGYIFLAESDGTPILDCNGEKIYLRTTREDESHSVPLDMTSAEFKELIEGRNQNGTIDTVPEALDAMAGLEENTEYSEVTEEDVDETMRDKFGV